MHQKIRDHMPSFSDLISKYCFIRIILNLSPMQIVVWQVFHTLPRSRDWIWLVGAFSFHLLLLEGKQLFSQEALQQEACRIFLTLSHSPTRVAGCTVAGASREKMWKAEGDHLQEEVEKKFQTKTLFQVTADDFSFPILVWPLPEERVMLSLRLVISCWEKWSEGHE